MRILLVGATGMIGDALATRLSAAGHAVVIGARDVDGARNLWPHASVVRIDYTTANDWPRALDGIDAVINAVGIFTEQGAQTFDALHVDGPVALFEAAAARGIRIVQLSALGADARSPFAYMASKGRADAALLGLPGAHTIVRPSLVFSPHGASTQWFATLAALPLTPLPGDGLQCVQPVHIDDLCEAILRLIASTHPPQQLDAVGPRPITLRAYLETFKRALRLPGMFVPIPRALLRATAPIAAKIAPMASPEAFAMLDEGNTADATGMTEVLGRPPRAPATFFDDADALRRDAHLAWLIPLLRVSVAITWIVTGIVSAFVYPTHAGLALLARTGLHGAMATFALYGAALLDLALGVAMLTRRFRTWSYRAQLLLIAFYTIVITLCLPEYWAHPYGPILKNLPLMAAILALHALDAPHGPARR